MATREVKCHFDLDLNTATCRDKKQLEFRITTLTLYLLEEISPLQLAIRNLLGVIYHYSGQYHKAYESFSHVLKHDKDNLNALENIARVCFRLRNPQEEEEFRARYQTIENNSPGANITARFKAEHAYAHAFECYRETNELRRYQQSNEMYLECLDMTSGMTDMNKERAEWKMCMVWNYKKLFNRHFIMDRRKENNEDLYPKILETLYEILNLVPNNQYLRCRVYGYLGYFSWKRPISRNETTQDIKDMPIPKIITENGMEKDFQNPELFFKTALKVREEIEVLQLFAGWLQSEKRFDESLNILNRCVEMKPIDSNYFSYSKRGEVLYDKTKMLSGEDGTLNPSAEEYLDKAIANFEFAATVDPSSYLFGFLGSAYCLRSDKGKDPQMKANCLGAFERGLDCLDGRHDPFLHSKHADCFRQFGEDDYALQATKRSIESQRAQNNHTKDIEFLLEVYIEKMASGSPEVVTEVLPDIMYWFCVAFCKYDRSAFSKMFTTLIIKHCRKLHIGIFTQMFINQDGEINQFCVEALKQQKVISAYEECFDVGLLRQILSTASPVKLIKYVSKSIDLQPRNRSGFDYDFYVIYSNKDSDWVFFSLLNFLEKTRGFKGYLDHRDFTPGMTIFNNIETAIEKSFKFILVITPNFLESGWCELESQSALTKALNKKKEGLIIPIVKDGAEVPDFLKTVHHIYLEDSLMLPSEDFQYERLAKALDTNPK